jgi:hypothetical protein
VSAGVWTAFLLNFVFWTGLAAGAVAFAALLELTGGQWAEPLRLTAQQFQRFLPVSVALYAVLLVGASAIYPWMQRPTGSSWLRFAFFASRDAAALVAMAFAAMSFFHGRTGECTRAAVLFLIDYAVGFTVLAIDLVMSLAAPWGSTLFPAYVFTATLYAAIAALVVAAVYRAPASLAVLTDERACDVGNLLLGFALLWMYLVWSQYLVIWYGNLPEEVSYLTPRLYGRWQPLAWTVWSTRFAIPFAVLLARAGKRRMPVVIIALVTAAGFWAECFLLVAPAAAAAPTLWGTVAVTIGFFALFAATTLPRAHRAADRAVQ